MHILPTLLAVLLTLTQATAQFQFFDQFFGGQQQQQQPQNMASDSEWYQTQYAAGKIETHYPRTFDQLIHLLT